MNIWQALAELSRQAKLHARGGSAQQRYMPSLDEAAYRIAQLQAGTPVSAAGPGMSVPVATGEDYLSGLLDALTPVPTGALWTRRWDVPFKEMRLPNRPPLGDQNVMPLLENPSFEDIRRLSRQSERDWLDKKYAGDLRYLDNPATGDVYAFPGMSSDHLDAAEFLIRKGVLSPDFVPVGYGWWDVNRGVPETLP